MLCIKHGCLEIIDAIMIGIEAFFAPDIEISPTSGFPPVI
jgi:hypothetical protein